MSDIIIVCVGYFFAWLLGFLMGWNARGEVKSKEVKALEQAKKILCKENLRLREQLNARHIPIE